MMRKNRGAAGRLAIPELGLVFDFLRSERYPERSGIGIIQRAKSDEGISKTMRSPYEVPGSPNGQNVKKMKLVKTNSQESKQEKSKAHLGAMEKEASSKLRSAN